MGQDTQYRPIPFIYASRGLSARYELDRVPEGYYIQLMNGLEREENSMSSRFGYTIINRDPDGTTNGQNYYFTSPVVTIAKLNYQNNPQRFVGLGDGSLWQRNSNQQGPYTELTLPETVQGTQITLSGQPFGWIVQSCFETSLPFLFIYDGNASVKVAAGSSTPELTGIDPPVYTLNTLPYSPLLIMIDNFSASNSYATSGVSSWGWGAIETLNANSGQLITDFSQFYGILPASGGGTRYPSSGSVGSGSASASQSSVGTSTSYSSAISGFSSVVPPSGETVTLYVTFNGYVQDGTITQFFVGQIGFQYSTDGGVTWNTGALPGYNINTILSSKTYGVTISVSNLALVQVRAVAIATVEYSPGGGTVTAYSDVTSVYATISNPGAFGPIVNGMLSVLNTNAQAVVPISQVVSINEVGGIYTQLQVQTLGNHNLSASNTMAIYGSSNDLVDGFYQVASVTASNAFTVPFQSAVALGAAGGYVTYAAATTASEWANTPPACILTDQYTTPYPSQMSAFGFYEWVPPDNTTFPIGAWSGTVSASSTATVSNGITLDLSQSNQVTDQDLIVLTLLTSAPENIAQVELDFFVGKGTDNYYQALIAPAYFQGAIAGNTLAYQATQNQILADTLNLISGQTPGTTAAQLQPTNLSTGANSWAACLIPRGNFLPVGQAGQAGVDWSNVTGWQLIISTNTNGGASFSVNGMYLQWGYGPSSFAGVGYDWRYTYYNANTGTESSPNPIQAFNQDYGYLASTSSPFFLRQAAQNLGYYSTDPQVTHVRLYRRGGILASNWVQVSQWENVTGGGQFLLKDVVSDTFLLQAPPLVLDNDPPVTSSLVNPIQTTLAAATTISGLSSIFSTFSPQPVTVAQSTAVFVPNQLVEVGNANNIEVVSVVKGGTGTFTAILRLEHNQGEPVNVYAVPRQPCNLCCVANLPGGSTQVLLAGDMNNPARIYYAKPNQPETFGPQNYLDVGPADDPVMNIINWRGTTLVVTQKTWYVFVGGSQPYTQPTGAAHGLASQQGWAFVEGAIWFQASDGLREFTGADGNYKTLPVEWLYRTNPECLPPQVSASNLSSVVVSFFNQDVYASYISLDGQRYRLIYSLSYDRFRQDDIGATAMLWEKDTNQFLCGVQIGASEYAIVQDQQYNKDYDDGGWSNGALVETPINLTIQLPFKDLGSPHFPKQWNVLETDVNTQNQSLQTSLIFNTEPQQTIVLPAINSGTVRQKLQQQISDGTQGADGYEAYAMSILHTMAVITAPILFQENVYAAVLADYRSSFDSYWQKSSSDELKLWKEGYFDYQASDPVTFSLYMNGYLDHPYYQFTLPAQTDRSVVRVLFPAMKCRLWRMIGVSSGSFQLWSPVQIDSKQLEEGSGYMRGEYGVYL